LLIIIWVTCGGAVKVKVIVIVLQYRAPSFIVTPGIGFGRPVGVAVGVGVSVGVFVGVLVGVGMSVGV
jgi:hypothetical protein